MDTKLPTHITSEVLEREETLLNFERVSEKILAFMFFTILCSHQTFELENVHVTFFTILFYHGEVFSDIYDVSIFHNYILN